MGKGHSRVRAGVVRVLVALTIAPVDLSAGTPTVSRPFWVCVAADGVRKAQDRACADHEQTLSAPPGVAVVAPPAANANDPQPAAVTAPRRTATPVSTVFEPLVDTVVKGFSLVAVVLLAVGAIKLFVALAIKRARRASGGRGGRRPARTAAASAATSRAEPPPSPLRAPAVPPPMPAESVTTPLAADAVWTAELIRELEWKRFEELCAQFWQRKGYPARLTGPGADGGVDVVIPDRREPARNFAVAQCKSWSSKPVGVEPVRALWGAKDHFKANLAMFYALSGFTPEARAFADGKHLKLISGEDLLKQIQSMPLQDQNALRTHVTRGDYITPTCPACDTKMHRRSGKDGKPDFWGCNNFRRCGAKPIICRSA